MVGLIAGWLANKVMGADSSNIWKNLFLGLVGSVVGGLVGSLIGLHSSNIIGSIILAVIGACLATWIYNKFIAK